MAKKSGQAATKVKVEIGDFVLMGGTRASYPWHWYLGKVLWVGEDDVLLERGDNNDGMWRDVDTISAIRAVGPMEQLVAAQKQAGEGVREFQIKVSECETELGRARAALFAKLEDLAAAGVKIIPPDFEMMEDERLIERAAVEASETREAAFAVEQDLFASAQ